MDGREIPGFYYDPEKKKYFKIQNARHAPPPNFKYSLDNVRKERKRHQLEKEAKMKKEKQQKETIVRWRPQDSTTCASIEREIGLRRTSYYIHAARPDSSLSLMSTTPQIVVDCPREGTTGVRLFDRDPATKTLYAVHADNQILRRRVNAPNAGLIPPDLGLGHVHFTPGLNEYSSERNEYTFERWEELHRLTSTISSFEYLPRTGALAATTLGSDRAPVVHFSDPDRDGPYVAQQFTPKDTISIWTAKARPVSFSVPPAGSDNSVPAADVENLAVGTSNAMLLFTRLPCGTWKSEVPFRSKSDVLAIDWLSPRTTVMGCRDGSIHLYDTRSRGFSSLIKHPFPISSLTRTDHETRLVCGGLEDSLCLYDIRSLRLSSPTNSNRSGARDAEKNLLDMYPYQSPKYKGESADEDKPYYRANKKRRKIRSTGGTAKRWTEPILRFQHSNTDDLQLAVDLHPQMGLIAAAQYMASGAPAVRIHNLWTGKTVKEIKMTSLTPASKQQPSSIHCLKFMDTEDEMNLWATWAGSIVRFIQ